MNTPVYPPDNLERVNIMEPNDVRYWCNLFNCTEVQLLTAVSVVGTRTQDVRKHATGRGYRA